MTATVYAALASCVLHSALTGTATPSTGASFSFSVTSPTTDPTPIADLHLWIRSAADPAGTWMEGWVTSADGASFTFYSIDSAGSGSHSDWVAEEGQIGFSNVPYQTHSADTPPHAPFIPRIFQAVEISRAMFDRGLSGRARVEVGDLVLQNTDGALDPIRRYGWDGQAVDIRAALTPGQDSPSPTTSGPVAEYPVDWSVVVYGTMAAPTADSKTIRLQLRTRQFDLDKPVQANLYAGDNALPNGVEGNQDDLEGKPKPLAWGEPFNVAPPLCNTALLIHQVNDGLVSNISAVYDGQVPLTKGADYASLADMYASAPSAGQYRCLYTSGGSYFRLGADAEFQVTCDVTVGATTADRTAAAITTSILALANTGLSVSAGDITALAADAPQALDLWLDQETTASDALDMVFSSIGGWWGLDAFGVFRCGVLSPPSGSPAWTFRLTNSRGQVLRTSESDIQEIELAPIQDQTGGLPVKSMQVRYARCWTVQTSGLAATATAARKAFVAEQYRSTVKAAATDIATRNVLAEDFVQDTLIHARADAATERARLLQVRGTYRDRLRLRVRLEAGVSEVAMGSVVQVVHPRWGCADGRLFRVTGMSIDARARVLTFELWG